MVKRALHCTLFCYVVQTLFFRILFDGSFSFLMNRDRLHNLLQDGREAFLALEYLVDSLHENKPKTIQRFISHPGSEDLIWALIKMLHNPQSRTAGNAAYVLGNLAEHVNGRQRLLELIESKLQDRQKLVTGLIQLLRNSDEETVMNAAGTIGTLAESQQGREWMLQQSCIDQLIENILVLLHNEENIWIASNSALVLARFTISEAGCQKILSYRKCSQILTRLILCLGFDEAGRGMNAAFAIGRLCDTDDGRQKLLELADSDKMIEHLSGMLSCPNGGASKNACFALSCLASSADGHDRIIQHPCLGNMKIALSELLNVSEEETAWFAAMTIRTISAKPTGCVAMRQTRCVEEALKLVSLRHESSSDLYQEAETALAILKRLPKPNLPSVTACGAHSASVTWDCITHKSGFPISYQLFLGGECIYNDITTNFDMTDLTPNTEYSVRIRALLGDIETGPFSDAVVFCTDEDVPSAPLNFNVDTRTASQIRLSWDSPQECNGVIKAYVISREDAPSETTQELSHIFSGLSPDLTYKFSVSAVTGRGKGYPAELLASTRPLGDHSPSKPTLNALGRYEIAVSWQAPELPLGRITRYDVLCNSGVVYSGTDQNTTVRSLNENTDYTFTVVAITSAGRFESRPNMIKTLKDEYNPPRKPLYTPVRRASEDARRSSSTSQSSIDQFKQKENATKKRKVRRKSMPKYWFNPTNTSELRRSKTELTVRPTTPTFREADNNNNRPTLSRGKTKLKSMPKSPDPDWLTHIDGLAASREQLRKKASDLSLNGANIHQSSRKNGTTTTSGVCHTILLDADLPNHQQIKYRPPIEHLRRSRTCATMTSMKMNRSTLPLVTRMASCQIHRSFSEVAPPRNSPTHMDFDVVIRK